MLSRIAESLYWMGRYVERAEDTARILDVHIHRRLEDPSGDEEGACRALLGVMGVAPDACAGTISDVIDDARPPDARHHVDRRGGRAPPGRTPAAPATPSRRRCGSA